MRILTAIFVMVAAVVCIVTSGGVESVSAPEPLASLQDKSHKAGSGLQPNSLCASTEHIIFSCRVKNRANRSKTATMKIASLCASSDLDKEHGYLQYRYGLPGTIELEFPNSRTGTQQLFQYTHYFRYQVDLTEINFQIDGYQYQIFDTYNGEEKLTIAEQGVTVTAPGKAKEQRYVCLGKRKADFSMLQDVLPHED